jgi:hypothetical protein
MTEQTIWPEGKRFAFTVFDDTDAATLDNVPAVYAFLGDLGLRTTKSCWPIAGDPNLGTCPGQTCEHQAYRDWTLRLQTQGFEIGWHNSTWHGVPRARIIAALDEFSSVFGQDPKTAANHSRGEGIYWGPDRVSSWHVWVYNLLTRFRESGQYGGHVPKSEFFWGDVCKQRIKYYRNFVFPDINTLRTCPIMPYHDPLRPYVNHWFASSEGGNVATFNRCLAEANQDRLEAEGGACIMYTHFADGFCDHRRLDRRFERLMRRLAAKDGWFVPVGELLDFLLEQRGHHKITGTQRSRLERGWLAYKVRVGTT